MKRSTTISLVLVAAITTACGSPSNNCDKRNNPSDPHCHTVSSGGGAAAMSTLNSSHGSSAVGTSSGVRSGSIEGDPARGASSTVSRGGFGESFAGHGSFGG